VECRTGNWRTHASFTIDGAGKTTDSVIDVAAAESANAEDCALRWTRMVLKAARFPKPVNPCRFGVDVNYDDGKFTIRFGI
jgi:hypothetical protein